MDHQCLAEVDEALRALKAVKDLLDDPQDSGGRDAAITSLAILEAARSARDRTSNLVALLSERALQQGASPAAMGFDLGGPRL